MISVFGLGNIVGALGDRNYGRYAVGNVVSLVGFWMQKVGVGWLTWQLTESGAWLGMMAFADMFPVVVFAPIAGTIADRWDVMRVIKLAQWLSMIQALVLCVLTATGLITIEVLLGLTAVMGFFSAFHQPARLAIIPALVEREHLSAAVAIGAISFNSAQFLGPALAGVTIVASGVAGTFAANAVTYAVFLAALARVRVREGRTPDGDPARGLFAQLADGVRYAARHPGIRSAMVMIAAIALCARPFAELFPGFADAVFAAGPPGLAILTSSLGAGAVTGALWLARRREPVGLTRVIVGGFLIASFSLVVFLATDRLWVAAPAVAAAGFCITSVGVGTQILLQTSVDEKMRGRVMSLYVVLFRALPALGALVMGAASEAVGLRPPVAAGAALTFLVFAWAWPRRQRMAGVLEDTASAKTAT